MWLVSARWEGYSSSLLVTYSSSSLVLASLSFLLDFTGPCLIQCLGAAAS